MHTLSGESTADCDFARACLVPRPRLTGAIFACVILAGSLFPLTNLCTLLVRSVLGPPSCLPDVSCEYCDMWLACVLNVALTGIRTMVILQYFGRFERSIPIKFALRAHK